MIVICSPFCAHSMYCGVRERWRKPACVSDTSYLPEGLRCVHENVSLLLFPHFTGLLITPVQKSLE